MRITYVYVNEDIYTMYIIYMTYIYTHAHICFNVKYVMQFLHSGVTSQLAALDNEVCGWGNNFGKGL